MKIFLVYLLIFVKCVLFSNGVRVCSSFTDYLVSSSENCYDNPVGEMNITQVLWSWGLTVEQYKSVTADNYTILTIRAYGDRTSLNNTPIILAHGFIMNSLGFVDSGNRSIVHFLAKNGYDIWLANFRGTVYSLQHQYLKPSNPSYWEFGFNEIAIYDLDVIVDLVYEKTRKKAILYGYSMGTTVTYIYASEKSQKADNKLKGIISAAPVAFMKNSRTIARFVAPFNRIIYVLVRDFVANFVGPTRNFLTFCAQRLSTMILYFIFKSTIGGYDFIQIDPIYFPIQTIFLGDLSSLRTLAHFAQLMLSNEFQNFDFGITENFQKYQQVKPSIYQINQIQVPVALFVGQNDYLATLKDTKKLYCQLNIKSRCGYTLINYPIYSHEDFIHAKDNSRLYLPYLLQSIKVMDSGQCSIHQNVRSKEYRSSICD